MFAAAEKTNQSATVVQQKAQQQSFFRKAEEESFFGSNERPSFFNAPVQAKLAVSSPDDPQEKEADAVAETVMRMPDPVTSISASSEEKIDKKEEEEVQTKIEVPAISKISRKEDEGEEIQAKHITPVYRMTDESFDSGYSDSYSAGGGAAETISRKKSGTYHSDIIQRSGRSPPRESIPFEQTLSSSKGSGSALPGNTREFMESRFNADFSGVRIHTGATAQSMSSTIHAQAFAHGNDIYFNEGKFSPQTESGGTLLAHELTHTIQQGASPAKTSTGIAPKTIARKNSIQRSAAGVPLQLTNAFFGETSHDPFFKPLSAGDQVDTLNRKCVDCEKEDKVQRAADKKEEEEKVPHATDKKEEEKVQKKEMAVATANKSTTASNYISSINSKGQSMDAGVQSFYENRMGTDFSDVKIHTGKEAAESARDINAQAYAYGNHIVFNEGKYQPESGEGKHLLAHELTHVVQKRKNTDQQSVQRNVLSTLVPGLDVGQALSMATTAVATAVAAVPAVIAAGSVAIITIGGLALAGDTWFKFQQLKNMIEARTGQKVSIVALATSILIDKEFCPPFSVIGALIPGFDVDGESSSFGKMVEMVIIGDYCRNNPCTTESHYFDDNSPINYVTFLHNNNPGLKYNLYKAKSVLKRPDIMAHLGSLKEFYEIKPDSVDGRSAGREKLSILDAYWGAFNLPYKRGTNYLQAKKEIPILGSLAKLRFFRKGPGLILYDICFKL